jgi:DNA-binding NarL/FixJ family response regulator
MAHYGRISYAFLSGTLPAGPSREGIIVRTALVCVRTSVMAQSIAVWASRLGVTTVRTAVSEVEALAQLGRQPAELILADTAVTRPDPVGFTQRVLEQAPGAVLLLFGTAERHVAAATVAAGARGLIHTADSDVVATVTKALLLIGARTPTPNAWSGPGLRTAVRLAGGASAKIAHAASGRSGGPVVPAQRADAAGPGERRLRHASLSARELQVLRGMAEGKSNAEIGRDLFLSEQTVKTHARRLYRKLRARDRAHAVAVGFRSGTLS